MNTQGQSKVFGLLAEFETTPTFFHACEKMRDAGYTLWDAHTPFPIHGLDEAMGLARSRVPFWSLVVGLSGAAGGMLLQWWVSAVEYPVIASGKPFFSWPAFVPIMFELSVLGGALGAVISMFYYNRLPRHHHPLFNSARFARASDDRFFISVEASDPKYDVEATTALLRELGATHVETVED